jgi:DNA-binding MarR family transcriptional regulator
MQPVVYFSNKEIFNLISEFDLQRQLIKLGNQLSSRRNADLTAHELTTSQSETLLYFANHPGYLISNLKDHLQVSHQAAQKTVMKLRQRQLLAARTSTIDARKHQLYLTAAGKQLATLLKQNGTLAGQQLLVNLTKKQKEQLAQLVALLLTKK